MTTINKDNTIQECSKCGAAISFDNDCFYIYCNNTIEEDAPIIFLECIKTIYQITTYKKTPYKKSILPPEFKRLEQNIKKLRR